MEIEFADKELARLELDVGYKGRWAPEVIRQYCKVINLIRQVDIWPDLYTFKSLRLEKLKGKRQGEHSMRINKQYRMIVRFRKEQRIDIATILGIEDHYE